MLPIAAQSKFLAHQSAQPSSAQSVASWRKCAHPGRTLIKPYSNCRVWRKWNHCPSGHPHERGAAMHNRTTCRGCLFRANKAVCLHDYLTTSALDVAAHLTPGAQVVRMTSWLEAMKESHGHTSEVMSGMLKLTLKTDRHHTGCPLAAASAVAPTAAAGGTLSSYTATSTAGV